MVRKTTSPALKTSQLIPALEMNEFNATGTIIFSSEKMNIDAGKAHSRYSEGETENRCKSGLVSDHFEERLQSIATIDHGSFFKETGILSKKLFDMIVLKAITMVTYRINNVESLSVIP